MKKSEYSRMFRGGTGGMPGSSAALLIGRGSTPTKLGGSHPFPRKGSEIEKRQEYFCWRFCNL